VVIEKVIMETREGNTIDLLTMPKDSYGWLYGTLIKDGNNSIATVVKAQMNLAKKRWHDKI